jgi:uncharacterized protein YdeI (YjbR/CyaY-like superfamily)
MPKKPFETLDVPTAEAWHDWLAEHHATASEIWLVFHKVHTGKPSLSYEDAVDEALCFGWVDSLIKRLDDDRYARKFTPRNADSRWSTINRQRYAKLKAAGRLMRAGLDRPPTNRSGDMPKPPSGKIPRYMEQALKKHRAAWTFFQSLTPRQQLMYIVWIDSARHEATKQKRLQEAIRKLVAGQKPGLQ